MISTIRRFSLGFVFLLTSLAAHAGPVYTGFFSNTAVGGYDTVSYHQGEPVKGGKAHQTQWMGADWYFSSAENLALFKDSPERYAPAFGGHCAWALAAKDDLVKGDPEVWAIVDEVLYLNYSKSVQKTWNTDRPGFIRQANANWPRHQ